MSHYTKYSFKFLLIRLKVFGSKGSMESGNKRPLDLYHTTLDGSLHDPIYTDCCDRYAQSYQKELDHFVSVLRGTYSYEMLKLYKKQRKLNFLVTKFPPYHEFGDI